MAIQPTKNPSRERSSVTAHLSLDSLTGRILIMIIVVGVACALHLQGHDLAMSVLLATVVLGAAADVASRVSPREAK